jgi:hypothetical protein
MESMLGGKMPTTERDQGITLFSSFFSRPALWRKQYCPLPCREVTNCLHISFLMTIILTVLSIKAENLAVIVYLPYPAISP